MLPLGVKIGLCFNIKRPDMVCVFDAAMYPRLLLNTLGLDKDILLSFQAVRDPDALRLESKISHLVGKAI